MLCQRPTKGLLWYHSREASKAVKSKSSQPALSNESHEEVVGEAFAKFPGIERRVSSVETERIASICQFFLLSWGTAPIIQMDREAQFKSKLWHLWSKRSPSRSTWPMPAGNHPLCLAFCYYFFHNWISLKQLIK